MNPYTDIFVTFLHGFRSTPCAMKELASAIPYNETTYENCPQRIRYHIPFLSLGQPSFPLMGLGFLSDLMNMDRVQDLWVEAEVSVHEKGRAMAMLYNEYICHNGSLLLVAHSLGTEIAANILKSLRHDIKCHFIALGGVASVCEIAGLIKERTNLNVYNFLNTCDAAIEGFYEGLGGSNFDCAGMNEIEGATNLNFDSVIHGHSGYLSSSIVKNKIRHSYDSLSSVTPRNLISHSEYVKNV